MDATLDRLLRKQHECVGAWQLRRCGWSEQRVTDHLPRLGLRHVEGLDGVWTSVRGELTSVQRWSAATRTAPRTALCLESAGRHRGVLPDYGREPYITVVRRGDGGPRQYGDVLVHYVRRPLVAVVDGIPTTDVTSTLIDLITALDDDQLRRAVIEALRLKKTTLSMIRKDLPRRRGAPRMRALLDDLEDLPIARCRSNAEGQALWRLKTAGSTIPEVNRVVAGYEADQVDFERREITELDSDRWHADAAEDAKRTRAWEGDGFTVERRPTEDAYDPAAQW